MFLKLVSGGFLPKAGRRWQRGKKSEALCNADTATETLASHRAVRKRRVFREAVGAIGTVG